VRPTPSLAACLGNQRLASLSQFLVQFGLSLCCDRRADEKVIEKPFKDVQIPFSFSGLDLKYGSSAFALDWMGREIANVPDGV
jgi:hypothetical protein